MGNRLTVAFSRAKYAAIGAAVGAAIGGLVSRNGASTGGGLGALGGAIVGEKRVSAEQVVERVKGD
jgi:osmotically inducible lipoprotein OsmB